MGDRARPDKSAGKGGGSIKSTVAKGGGGGGSGGGGHHQQHQSWRENRPTPTVAVQKVTRKSKRTAVTLLKKTQQAAAPVVKRHPVLPPVSPQDSFYRQSCVMSVISKSSTVLVLNKNNAGRQIKTAPKQKSKPPLVVPPQPPGKQQQRRRPSPSPPPPKHRSKGKPKPKPKQQPQPTPPRPPPPSSHPGAKIRGSKAKSKSPKFVIGEILRPPKISSVKFKHPGGSGSRGGKPSSSPKRPPPASPPPPPVVVVKVVAKRTETPAPQPVPVPVVAQQKTCESIKTKSLELDLKQPSSQAASEVKSRTGDTDDLTPIFKEDFEQLYDQLKDLNRATAILEQSYRAIIESLIALHRKQNKLSKRIAANRRPFENGIKISMMTTVSEALCVNNLGLMKLQPPPPRPAPAPASVAGVSVPAGPPPVHGHQQHSEEESKTNLSTVVTETAAATNNNNNNDQSSFGNFSIERFLDPLTRDATFEQLFAEIKKLDQSLAKLKEFYDNEGSFIYQEYENSDYRINRVAFDQIRQKTQMLLTIVHQITRVYNQDLLDMFRLRKIDE